MRLLDRSSRRLALVARLSETWFRRPATPNRVVLDLTRRCNLRCEMCRTWTVQPRHELTPLEIEAMFRALDRLVWLDLTGGEPFVRRDIEQVFDAVLRATPKLHVLHFQTNGWFTERAVRVADQVRARRPEIDLIITVSLDGPPAVHDRIRGRQGSFKRALRTLCALRELPGVRTYVGTTVTASNAGDVDALGGLLMDQVPGFEASDWHWNWLQISRHFFHNEGQVGPARANDLVRRHMARRGLPRSLVDFMELVFLVNLEFYRRGEPAGVTCQALRSTLFVSPEGDVFPCHVYDRPLGNIRDQDIREIWASKTTLHARADIEQLACGGCFTPCEAYPALAGAPVQTAAQTARRSLALLRERVSCSTPLRT